VIPGGVFGATFAIGDADFVLRSDFLIALGVREVLVAGARVRRSSLMVG
jgi:hypothetical protein